MALQTPATTVLFRRDIEENWQSVNPVLMIGEVGVVYGAIATDGLSGDLLRTEAGNTQLYFKIGDGKTCWNDLPVVSGKQGEQGDQGAFIEGVANQDIFNAALATQYRRIVEPASLLEVVIQAQYSVGQYFIASTVSGLPTGAFWGHLTPATAASGKEWSLLIKIKSPDAKHTVMEVCDLNKQKSFSIMRVDGVWQTCWQKMYDPSKVLQAGQLVLPSSKKLEAHCAWADGALVYFRDYPELRTQLEQGYIESLPIGTVASVCTANPFKWIEHAEGLYLPRLGGLFPRLWTPNQTVDAKRTIGSLQGDAIRNITGEIITHSNFVIAGGFGAFYTPALTGTHQAVLQNASYVCGGAVRFDTSRVVPTAVENRPVNYAQPVAVYLGNPSTYYED